MAALSGATGPGAARTDPQEQTARLAKALDVDHKIYSWGVADPAGLGPSLRAQIGDGFYMPPWRCTCARLGCSPPPASA